MKNKELHDGSTITSSDAKNRAIQT